MDALGLSRAASGRRRAGRGCSTVLGAGCALLCMLAAAPAAAQGTVRVSESGDAFCQPFEHCSIECSECGPVPGFGETRCLDGSDGALICGCSNAEQCGLDQQCVQVDQISVCLEGDFRFCSGTSDPSTEHIAACLRNPHDGDPSDGMEDYVERFGNGDCDGDGVANRGDECICRAQGTTEPEPPMPGCPPQAPTLDAGVAPEDAGAGDDSGALPAPDGGTEPEDAGTEGPPEDAGGAPEDAGEARVDGGSPRGVDPSGPGGASFRGDGGCRIGGGGAPAGALSPLLALIALARRRRRP